jgi:hypothetical protein
VIVALSGFPVHLFQKFPQKIPEARNCLYICNVRSALASLAHALRGGGVERDSAKRRGRLVLTFDRPLLLGPFHPAQAGADERKNAPPYFLFSLLFSLHQGK